MSLSNPIANMMSKILNADKAKKAEIELHYVSATADKILAILKKNGYIGEISKIESGEEIIVKVKLMGKINKCGIISPHFNVTSDNFEMYEKRFLPAKDFGMLIITAPQGVMTHYEAKEKAIGGRLLAYCY